MNQRCKDRKMKASVLSHKQNKAKKTFSVSLECLIKTKRGMILMMMMMTIITQLHNHKLINLQRIKMERRNECEIFKGVASSDKIEERLIT